MKIEIATPVKNNRCVTYVTYMEILERYRGYGVIQETLKEDMLYERVTDPDNYTLRAGDIVVQRCEVIEVMGWDGMNAGGIGHQSVWSRID